MADPTIVVTATVVTDNHEHVARAAESFARAIAGLALEGISVGLNIGTVDDEDGNEPE